MNKRYLYEYNAVTFLESHLCNAYFKSIKHEDYESVCLIKYIIIIASFQVNFHITLKYTGAVVRWCSLKILFRKIL